MTCSNGAVNPFWSIAYDLPMLAADGVVGTTVEQKAT